MALYYSIVQLIGMVELRNQLAEQERTIRLLVQTRENVDSTSELGVNEKSTLLNPLKHQAKASIGSKICHLLSFVFASNSIYLIRQISS